ncbi:MAG TPA: class I SAM-dependent methyltransferase [Vicinamibacteria bacterium]|jgi:S-adenosylmethionine-diacylgycerolhomoserine-N-methlytransferase|nr:class I SAM-dependent methyltransferase [Vicinamibacteria bacterium]
MSDASALDRLGLEALERFYRRQAGIYDWTRPFILFGRREIVAGLGVGPGHRVLDVGCGTGWNLGPLARMRAEVVGIECSPAMLRRAGQRVARLGERLRVSLDLRPYGTRADYLDQADRILFSYSLSMMPPYLEILARARADLRAGGRIGVVDFLDALPPVAQFLERSHVALGAHRLDELRRLFPRHFLKICSTSLWRYFLFWGEAD